MTIRQIRDVMKSRLEPIVGPYEARAMANAILEDVKGYTPTELVMYGERELLDETVDRLNKIVDRIIQGEPMQYVIGNAQFRGRNFAVNPSVLIPRPETSQLVDIIINQNQGIKDARVLDIGTGSGCIAISLALDLPFAKVDAIDIDADAVNTATGNAERHKARVNIIKADAFALDDSAIANNEYDIIVSNPPYVLQSERQSIDTRVKDYEPAKALFVSDEAPIDIYAAIAVFADKHLVSGGHLYFEINPLCDKLIVDMLKSLDFTNIDIQRDYKGTKRFAIATKR